MDTLWSGREYFEFWVILVFFIYYHIISCQRINVYRVERMDIVRLLCNNAVTGIFNPIKYYDKLYHILVSTDTIY